MIKQTRTGLGEIKHTGLKIEFWPKSETVPVCPGPCGGAAAERVVADEA